MLNYLNNQGLLKSPFYRVALRAIVRDDQQRVLVVENKDHTYELPGGGWEHDESFAENVHREFLEELGVEPADIGDVFFVYRGQHTKWGYRMLRVVLHASVKSTDFKPSDDMIAAKFVTKEEFLHLAWCDEDREVLEHIDKLWPPKAVTEQPSYPRQAYYRISLKALVFDDQQRLLVFKDDEGYWEMPGGGWDHEEDYQTCLERELAEEVRAKIINIGPMAFFYRCSSQNGHPKVALAFPVELASDDFTPADDNIAEAHYVSKDEFLQLPFQRGESPVQQYADQIWALVEKNDQNR